MRKTLEDAIREIELDNFEENLSAREKLIAERTNKRSKILTMFEILESDTKNTTEAWRNNLRASIDEEVEKYYKEYED